MKKNLLINFFLSATLITHAQVTITSDDLPVAGKGYLLGGATSGISSFTAGGTGNTTWDFSTITKTEQDTGGTLLLSQTPYPDAFPATHAAFNEDADGKTYSYFQLNTDNVGLTGLVFISSTLGKAVKLNTVQELTYYTLPITEGHMTLSRGTYRGKDAYSYQSLPYINVDSIEATILFEKGDTVDAYGSITTPTGTYDAIRLKTVATRTMSFRGRNYGSWTDASSIYPPNTVTETSYGWWAKGIGIEVFKITYEDGATTPTKVTWYETGAAPTGIEEESFETGATSIYPNPANTQMTIVPSISLPYEVRINNAQGELVKEAQNVYGTQQLDVSTLSPGLYVATLNTGTGKSWKAKFVVQR